MAKETERKFLVRDLSFIDLATDRIVIRQGYISRRKEGVVRVRLWNDRAFLTIKGANRGATRDEWEYEIPAEDARDMLSRCAEGRVIEKVRYIVPFEGYTWEVDQFQGCHKGLTVAEVEVASEAEQPPLPSFVGEEVTGDPSYYNSNLA